MQQIVEQVIQLTKDVGTYITKEAQQFDRSRIEHKGINDLVSYVDKQAEEKLVEGLRKIVPEAGFIAEEGTSVQRGEVYNWVIDPLDGTTNFIHGLPIFSISIALLQQGEVVLGVVYEPNRDECFYAVKGQKAYCNEKLINVSNCGSINQSLLATGFPYYNFDDMEKYLLILKSFMQNSHGLRRMGSAAVDLAYVACGRFEGFFEYNLNAWDVAAGAFIVQQAGGMVSDFKGDKNYIFGREIVASTKNIHHEMLQTIQKYWE